MSDDLAVQVAVFKALKDHATSRYNEVRAELAARMANGDRLMAVTVNGIKLGAVSKKDPKRVAAVVDEPALRNWVVENYPDRLVEDLDVIGSDEEVKEVLLRHAPGLLRQVSRPGPDLVRQILTDSARIGTPVGPGGEAEVPGVKVDQPEGTVSCLSTEDALPAVVDMLDAGTLDLFDVLPGGHR